MKAILITTNGECFICENDRWGYENIRDSVGGLIESVSLKNDGGMYINEEGKILGLPVNDVATLLADKFGYKRSFFDMIVGDAIVFGPVDSNGEETEVTDKIVNFLKDMNLL